MINAEKQKQRQAQMLVQNEKEKVLPKIGQQYMAQEKQLRKLWTKEEQLQKAKVERKEQEEQSTKMEEQRT